MNSLPGCSIPVISTERLQLAALGNHHFEAFAELHSDPQTMQFIGDGKPLDRVAAWLHMAMLLGHWHLRGYGVWAVEAAGTGELIGRVGLLHPKGWTDAELNWMIKPSMRGCGFASEAAQAVLDFAFSDLGFARLISLIRPGNAASSRVAAKLGGSIADTIEFMGSPMHVFRYERKNAISTQGA